MEGASRLPSLIPRPKRICLFPESLSIGERPRFYKLKG
jgi:hypothetical protein